MRFSLVRNTLKKCCRWIKRRFGLSQAYSQLSLFTEGKFLYIYRTERSLIAILNGSSWEDFRDSAGKPGKKLGKELIGDLVPSLMANISKREFAPFILHFYRWFLINWDNSKVKKSMITQMQDIMIPEIASSAELSEGQRWVISFDKRLTTQQKRNIIEQWLNDRSNSEDERIERWMAIHGLLVSARKFSAAESSGSEIEKVYSLYIDFLRDGRNSEIERIFGTAVEMDFMFFRDKLEGPLTRDWIQNILLKRFAIGEIIKGGKTIGLIILVSLSLVFLLYPLYDPPKYIRGIKVFSIFAPSYNFLGLPVFSTIPIFIASVSAVSALLIMRKLSLIIWGGFIGWLLFVLAGAYGDTVHQSLNWGRNNPQIFSSSWLGLLLVASFFLFASLYLFWQEVEDCFRQDKKYIVRRSKVQAFANII